MSRLDRCCDVSLKSRGSGESLQWRMEIRHRGNQTMPPVITEGSHAVDVVARGLLEAERRGWGTADE